MAIKYKVGDEVSFDSRVFLTSSEVTLCSKAGLFTGVIMDISELKGEPTYDIISSAGVKFYCLSEKFLRGVIE